MAEEEQKKKPMWKRFGKDSLFSQASDEMMKLLSHASDACIKEAEKDLKNLKRFKQCPQ